MPGAMEVLLDKEYGTQWRKVETDGGLTGVLLSDLGGESMGAFILCEYQFRESYPKALRLKHVEKCELTFPVLESLITRGDFWWGWLYGQEEQRNSTSSEGANNKRPRTTSSE